MEESQTTMNCAESNSYGEMKRLIDVDAMGEKWVKKRRVARKIDVTPCLQASDEERRERKKEIKDSEDNIITKNSK